MTRLISKLKSSLFAKKILLTLEASLLFLYVFSLPAFSERPGLNYITYAIVAILSLNSLLYLIIYSRIRINIILLAMPIFASWALVGTLLYSHEFRSWLSLSLLSISAFVMYFAFSCLKDIFKCLLIVVFGLLGFSAYFIIHYWSEGTLFSGDRLGDFFANVNFIGAYMTIGVITSVYLLLFCFKKWLISLIAPIIIFSLVGFLTGSKAFLISTFLTILTILFIKLKKHKIIFIVILVSLLVVIFILLQLPLLATLKKRLDIMFSLFLGRGSDTSTATRFLWQEYAFVLGSGNLITGYGSNGFSIYSGVGSYSHGNIAEVICNFGIPGVLLFYSLPFYCAYKTISLRKYHPFIIAFGAYFFLTGFLTVNYYSKATYLIFSLIVFALEDEKEKNYGKISFLY